MPKTTNGRYFMKARFPAFLERNSKIWPDWPDRRWLKRGDDYPSEVDWGFLFTSVPTLSAHETCGTWLASEGIWFCDLRTRLREMSNAVSCDYCPLRVLRGRRRNASPQGWCSAGKTDFLPKAKNLSQVHDHPLQYSGGTQKLRRLTKADGELTFLQSALPTSSSWPPSEPGLHASGLRV